MGLTREQREFIRRVRDEIAREVVGERLKTQPGTFRYPGDYFEAKPGYQRRPGDWMPFADLGGLGERSEAEAAGMPFPIWSAKTNDARLIELGHDLWTLNVRQNVWKDAWLRNHVLSTERWFRLARGDTDMEEFVETAYTTDILERKARGPRRRRVFAKQEFARRLRGRADQIRRDKDSPT